MTYEMINNIFDLMQNTIKGLNDVDEIRVNLKKQGKHTETENLLKIETNLTSVLLTYRGLIENYVKSANAVIDNFDDDFEQFLEGNIYDLEDYYYYGYCEDAISEIKAEMREKFYCIIWSSVVEENFYNMNKDVQAFINGFDRLDLYLYIISKV